MYTPQRRRDTEPVVAPAARGNPGQREAASAPPWEARLRLGCVVCLVGFRRLLFPSYLDVGKAELSSEFDQDADADQDVEDGEDLDRRPRDREFRVGDARCRQRRDCKAVYETPVLGSWCR